MSHTTPGEPPSARPPAGGLSAVSYSNLEWRLLTRLPGRVVVAATSLDPPDTSRVTAVLAGLDGIAAGRASDSDLVRAVAAEIYTEPEDRPPFTAPIEPADGVARVLADCRSAVRVLAGPTDPADSAAYRQWVQSVAARVCRADDDVPPSTGPGRLPGVRRRKLLVDLGVALGLG